MACIADLHIASPMLYISRVWQPLCVTGEFVEHIILATRAFGLCAAIWCNSGARGRNRHKWENHFPCAKKYSISKSRSFYRANMTFMSWHKIYLRMRHIVHVQVWNEMEVSSEPFHDISCRISSLEQSIWCVVCMRGAHVTVIVKSAQKSM